MSVVLRVRPLGAPHTPGTTRVLTYSSSSNGRSQTLDPFLLTSDLPLSSGGDNDNDGGDVGLLRCVTSGTVVGIGRTGNGSRHIGALSCGLCRARSTSVYWGHGGVRWWGLSVTSCNVPGVGLGRFPQRRDQSRGLGGGGWGGARHVEDYHVGFIHFTS